MQFQSWEQVWHPPDLMISSSFPPIIPFSILGWNLTGYWWTFVGSYVSVYIRLITCHTNFIYVKNNFIINKDILFNIYFCMINKFRIKINLLEKKYVANKIIKLLLL
jgi:hypothetical protein